MGDGMLGSLVRRVVGFVRRYRARCVLWAGLTERFWYPPHRRASPSPVIKINININININIIILILIL